MQETETTDDKTYGGIAFDKLYLVRIQGRMDGCDVVDGALVLDRAGYKSSFLRNTFHFTLNATVRDHIYGGGWDKAGCVIIAPMETVCKKADNSPAAIMPADTYFHADTNGKFSLPDAVIIAQEGTVLPENLQAIARTYPQGETPEETIKNREKAVAEFFKEKNAPFRDVSTKTWINDYGGEDYPDEKDANALARHVSKGHETSATIHDGSPDGKWEGLRNGHSLGTDGFEKRVLNFKSGARLESNFDGIEYLLFDRIEQNLEAMEQFIQQRKINNADPKAIAFYEKGYSDCLETFKKEIIPLHIEEQTSYRQESIAELSHQYHVYDGVKKIGPLTANELMDGIDNGSITENYRAWRKGMEDWLPLNTLPEHRQISDIAEIGRDIAALQEKAGHKKEVPTLSTPPISSPPPLKRMP